MISNFTSCCEDWGYFSSEDDYNDFIGAELLNVVIVDDALKCAEMDKFSEYHDDAIFVNLETSKGVLQFAVYNSHNGYYGHTVRITSKQVTEEYEIQLMFSS